MTCESEYAISVILSKITTPEFIIQVVIIENHTNLIPINNIEQPAQTSKCLKKKYHNEDP